MFTSKERVITTIHHKEPDRVPVGEWGIDHDHVSKIIGRKTYWRNRKEETIAIWEGRRDEVVESQKYDCMELVEKLEYDIITVGLVPPKGFINPDPPKKIKEDTWEDSQGNIYRYAASNDSIVRISHKPSKEEITDNDLAKAFEAIDNFDDTRFELVEHIGRVYGDNKAIVFRGIDIYGSLMSFFGGDNEHQLILPLLAADEIKKLYGFALEYNKKLIQNCVRNKVLICMQGADFGMKTSTIMSPRIIRDLFFPLIKKVNEEIVKHGMIPFFHSCGNIWDILDDYVLSGYKGYQSIQESAGMNTRKVKEKYGHALTLWTGVQCETLVEGTIKDLEKEVEENLSFLMPGGGFIFGSTNSVQYGAKTENYLKALEIVRKSGVYE